MLVVPFVEIALRLWLLDSDEFSHYNMCEISCPCLVGCMYNYCETIVRL